MSAHADIAWSRELAATSRRQVALWGGAAMVMFAVHASAAWYLTRQAPEPAEQVAGGAIEIELAALGFSEADQLAAGEIADPVETVEATAAEVVETLATPVAPVTAPAVDVEPVEALRQADTAVSTEIAATEPTDVQLARPVEVPHSPPVAEALPVEQPRTAPSDVADNPPIETTRPSDVTIAAVAPVQPAEAAAVKTQATQPPVEQAVPVPSDEPVAGEEVDVAAIVNVPLPTPRPDYTPTAMQRAEPRQAEQSKPVERTPPKKAQKTPPRRSGEGGENQQSASRGVESGSTVGRSAASGKSGKATQAGNAEVTNYPGKIRARLARAHRSHNRGSGDVFVNFVVNKSGNISSLRVVRSSGKPALDKAALDTVRRAAPFPPIPQAAGRSTWEFDFPITFSR